MRPASDEVLASYTPPLSGLRVSSHSGFVLLDMASELGPCPPRFVELKKEIAGSYPDFEARVTKAWGEILQELEKATKDIASKGSQVSEPSPASRRLYLAGL